MYQSIQGLLEVNKQQAGSKVCNTTYFGFTYVSLSNGIQLLPGVLISAQTLKHTTKYMTEH